MAWYRIPFFTDDAVMADPAVFLGRIGNADQTFFNGVRIGGEGVIGDQFSECEYKIRVYRIPIHLFRSDAPNLIAVRVMNTYRSGGILESPVCIGEYADLTEKKYHREFVRKLAETALTIFLLITLAVWMLMAGLGFRDAEFRYFGMFTGLYLLIVILNSLIFYETGLKSPLIQRVINTGCGLFPPIVLMLVLHLTKEKVSAGVKGIASFYGIISVLFLFPLSYSTQVLVLNIWSAVFPATIYFCEYFLIKAYQRKLHEFMPVFVGTNSFLIGAVLEYADMLMPRFYHITGPLECGMMMFLSCIMYAWISRFKRIQNEIHCLSAKILESHENERKRLSRELHDGIGQSLLGVKIHLQIIHAKPYLAEEEKNILYDMISEISDTAEELRQIAMDLRPATLERLGFTEVLKWYARKFTKNTGIRVTVQGDEGPDPDVKIKDHLYRIYQEALSNTARHSGADHAEVSVSLKGKSIHLMIKDNGTGFDPDHIPQHGLGLSTMRERTELLRGIFRIRSKAGKGTGIDIEIPIA